MLRKLTASILALAVLPAQSLAPPATEVPTAGLENRAGLTFSPDALTAGWVEWNGRWGTDGNRRTIYLSQLIDGQWSDPAVAPFSGTYSDDDPFFSLDGRWLYFVSNRPVDGNGPPGDADIWRFSLLDDAGLERLPVNSGGEEYSPVLSAAGTLYFASARDGDPGNGDLYRAEPRGDSFAPAERLGAAHNSGTGEWNLWVSPDEREMLFEASSRPTNVSVPGDLYYSWRSAAGWTPGLPVSGLNTPGSDLLPRLHPDGSTLYVTTAPIGGHARIVAADWPWLRAELEGDYAPTLLVANRSSHSVAAVDLARGEVVSRTGTGEGPHLLSNVSAGRVVATGYGVFPTPHEKPVDNRPPFVERLNSRATVIDVATMAVRLDRVIDDCARPHASWIVSDRAYVTCEDERQIVEIDLDSGTALRRFDTLQEGSHVIAHEPDSNTLAVTNTGSGSVTLIHVDSGHSRVVSLAGGSEGLLVHDRRFWVANGSDGSLAVVDPVAGERTGTVESVCGFPIALDAGPGPQIWVACFGSSEIVAVDPDERVVVRRLSLSGQPLNLVLHPERQLAYVSMPRQNAVAEVDLMSGDEIRRIPVGIEPDGLRWAE